MKPNYTVIIYTPQELNHSSYVQTGLFELKRQNIIEVKIKISAKKRLGRIIISDSGKISETNQAHPKTSFYKLINNKDNSEMFFGIDLYDFANHFSTEALEKCDFVFKRNYESELISCLPVCYQEKLYKLGMSFGVNSDYKRNDALFLMGLLISNLKINFKIDRFFIKRLFRTFGKQVSHWKLVNNIWNLARFQNFNKVNNETILFQTRCFLHEGQEDVIEIHKQRYQLIRLLRRNFPNQFMGGFIPSAISTEKYTDALSNVSSNPEIYQDVLKKAGIVIYTRGLANSPAWKMSVYLSQGKVIIAEPITAELPVPLQHGKEVLFFNTNEELVNNINLVLKDEKLADNLSKNARTYFEAHVHPVNNVKRIFDTMLANFEGN